MAAKFLRNEWRGNLRVAAPPRERSESWRSRGPSSGVDAGQGSLGETDGIIIHILSVLFISSKVSCFSSSCWEKWRDPYFWAGQITLSPLGDAAAFNTVSVSPLCVCVCVFQSHCFRRGPWLDTRISCGNYNWPQHAQRACFKGLTILLKMLSFTRSKPGTQIHHVSHKRFRLEANLR